MRGSMRWLDQAERGAIAADSLDIEREALARIVALAALARGDLTAADAALGRVHREAKDARIDDTLASMVVEGLVLLVTGRYGEAVQAARDALAAAEAEGIHAYDASLLVLAAVGELGSGKQSAARSTLQRLEVEGARLRRGDRACMHYLRAWLARARRRCRQMRMRDAKLALAVAVETGIPWFECLARIALAQLQMGSSDRRGAQAQLRAAETIAERLRSPWLSYAAKLAASEAAMVAGDRREALEAIGAAFRQGHEYGFRRPPGWHPRAMAELCVLALETQIEPDFARALVRDGRLAPQAPPLGVRRWPWPFRVMTFGGFQMPARGHADRAVRAKGLAGRWNCSRCWSPSVRTTCGRIS